MKAARVVIGLSCAFIIFTAFHASGVADLDAVEMILSIVHFGHFAKLINKVFKWGLKK